jgi:hypothetical protein
MQRKNKDWLKAFIDYASTGEAPLPTLFWTGVSTIAGALRRRVWIDQSHFQWVPNFYIILVAPPGIISKSTTANIGMNLLREVPGIKFGPNVVTWQALVQSMAGALELAGPIVETGEYLPMSAITIASSEFGNLLNPQDKQMVDILVDLWDGQVGKFEKETKASGNDKIENPWINIIACTTPAWISGNFPEYMIGGGFTSRCIFVFSEEKRQLIAYPAQHVPPDFKQKRADLIHDLEIISNLIGEYIIHPDAIAWGEEWYANHWKNKPPHLDNGQFGGYLARKQTHIHKLSIIIAASKRDELTILRDDLIFSEKMVTALEHDMPKVFSQIGQNEVTRGMAELVTIVQRYGTVNETTLYKELFRIMGYDEFSKALSSASRANRVSITQTGPDRIITFIG